MKDYLIKVLSKGMGIRGIACITNNLSRYASKQHETSPFGSFLLSRTLTAAALMGGLIKQNERIGLKFEGNGPVQKILAEAEGEGIVRGYIGNPKVDMDITAKDFDYGNAIGKAGLLTVVKDLKLKEPYSGTVHLVTGKIGEDLAYYLTESEQIPSAVGVSSTFNKNGTLSACGGFLVQKLPKKGGKGSTDANLESIITKIQSLNLTKFLSEEKTPEDILEYLFAEVPFDILQITDLSFKCTCSRDSLKKAIVLIGKDGIDKLIENKDGVDAQCEYCRKTYNFSVEELKTLKT